MVRRRGWAAIRFGFVWEQFHFYRRIAVEYCGSNLAPVKLRYSVRLLVGGLNVATAAGSRVEPSRSLRYDAYDVTFKKYECVWSWKVL